MVYVFSKIVCYKWQTMKKLADSLKNTSLSWEMYWLVLSFFGHVKDKENVHFLVLFLFLSSWAIYYREYSRSHLTYKCNSNSPTHPPTFQNNFCLLIFPHWTFLQMFITAYKCHGRKLMDKARVEVRCGET